MPTLISQLEARKIMGVSRTQFYTDMNNGLAPKSISVSERVRKQIKEEAEQVAAAKAARLSKDEIKQLVQQIHARREAQAAALREQLAQGK